MGLLDGGMRRVFGAAFGGIYPAATLHRRTRTEALNGDVSTIATDIPCRAQVESVSEAMRAAPGYTEQDIALRVLQAGIGAPPTTDDQVTAGGTRWNLSMISSDTALVAWTMRGTPA